MDKYARGTGAPALPRGRMRVAPIFRPGHVSGTGGLFVRLTYPLKAGFKVLFWAHPGIDPQPPSPPANLDQRVLPHLTIHALQSGNRETAPVSDFRKHSTDAKTQQKLK